MPSKTRTLTFSGRSPASSLGTEAIVRAKRKAFWEAMRQANNYGIEKEVEGDISYVYEVNGVNVRCIFSWTLGDTNAKD